MEFWQHIKSKLQDKHKIYLLTVIENSGSSPGRKGFKMLISDDGFIDGSIGGGVMEFNLVEEVRNLLREDKLHIFLKRQIHRGHKEHGSGMICSGEQTVVFHPLNEMHLPMIEDVIECQRSNKKGRLILTQKGIQFTKDAQKEQFEYEIKTAEDWIFKEKIDSLNTLYIVGGGHVSVAVSELFVNLGFRVIVYDDRENLNTLELNSSAHKKLVIDFNEIKHYIEEGSNSYLAIMTNRYIDDKLVLSKLINSNFAYIGVLGSKAKLKAMWEVLQREGISIAELNKVHGPIGLAIKSQTPEEIAVSIAAEVIRIKNKNA